MSFNKGMTLIEVLIAVSILLGGLFAVNLTWSGNYRRILKAQYHTNVSLFLYQKMAELETLYEHEDLQKVPDTLKGDFGTDYPEYQWMFESQSLKLPQIFQEMILSGDQGEGQTKDIVKKIEDFLETSVKEVRLTVHFTKNKHKLSYSLTTYFINYKIFSLNLGLTP